MQVSNCVPVSALQRCRRAFATDCAGNVSIMFGVMLVALMGLMGAGVDTARWNQAHTRTVAALDSAVVAAARALQLGDNPADAKELARKYFTDQTRGRISVSDENLVVTVADNNSGIEATLSASVQTPLLGVVGIDNLPIRATSKVAFSTGGPSGSTELEVALMLDVTGSMCDDGIGPCTSSTKLNALKTGAEDLIKIVIKDNSSMGPRARVALVPFSTRIRVGLDDANQTLMKALTNLDPLSTAWVQECTAGSGSGASEGAGNWTCTASAKFLRANRNIMPCVTDRTGDGEYTDDAPGAGRWLNAHDGSRRMLSWDHSDTPLNSSRGTEADPSFDWNYNAWGEVGYCSDVARANVIRPLSEDRNALIDHVKALEAYGSTSGALGTAWAWYMLSENWNTVWTGTSAPGNYADTAGANPQLRKVAVLMSDGLYNTFRGWKDSDPVEVSNRAKQLCANMKAKGIEIFTVGFDLDSLSATDRARAIDTLQSCGTDINHFYNSLDQNQLKQAFRGIALQMSRIYIAR